MSGSRRTAATSPSDRAALILLVWLVALPAGAEVAVFTDEASFTAALGAGIVGALETGAASLALADEVAAPPSADQDLGPRLRFRRASTGLCGDVVLETGQAGAGFVYEDDLEGAEPNAFPPESLSVGDSASFQNDDFEVRFGSGQVFAAGFLLEDNRPGSRESLRVIGEDGLALLRLEGAGLAASDGFWGFIADEPIWKLRFDEDPARDQVALRGVRIACITSDSDEDGLSDFAEYRIGTDPTDPDEDDDGLLDGEEVGPGSYREAGEVRPFIGVFGKVSLEDMDLDGDLDVAYATTGLERVGWARNLDGAGTFSDFFSTGSGQNRALATADLDGDRFPDLAVADLVADRVHWFRNREGLLSFGGATSANADSARSVVAADLDGDGDADLASASNNDDKIAWYENLDGLGTFGPQQIVSTQADQAQSVVAGDFDGDGDLDLASGSFWDLKVAWYENLGAAGFGPEQIVSVTAGNVSLIATGDLDGDGDLDLLSSSDGFGDKVVWYPNDGSGSFGAEQTIETVPANTDHLIVHDADADGDLDVLLTRSSPPLDVTLYRNDGQGSFGPREIVVKLGPTSPAGLDAGDLDGDGYDELVVAEPEVDWYEWLPYADPFSADSDGDGLGDSDERVNGTDPQVSDSDDDGLSDAVEVANALDPLDPDMDDDGLLDGFEFAAGFDPTAPDELDEDAEPDGVSNRFEQVAGTDPIDPDTDDDGVTDGDEIATGIFSGERTIAAVIGGAPRSVVAADFDADGDLDVAVAFNQRDEVRWYRGNGNGGFSTDTIGTGISGATQLAVVELNDDFFPDLAVAALSDQALWWRGLEDGLESSTRPNTGPFTIPGTEGGATAIAVGDLDGDGDDDIAFGQPPVISWRRNLGANTGTFGATLSIGPAASAFGLAIADLDGDEDDDVVAASFGDSSVLWYENTDGAGTFAAPQVVNGAALGALAVAAADLDGDGDNDLLSASALGERFDWYENTDGQGSFGPAQMLADGQALAYDIAAADMDSDGDLDVVWSASGAGRIAWHENTDGAGSFGPAQTVAEPGLAVEEIFPADVDADGDVDVVAAQPGNDRVVWFEQLNPLDPLNPDTDGDGLLDGFEIDNGYDPTDPDSDDDFLLDGFEVQYGFDPTTPGEADLDPDEDGWTNLTEQRAGSNPLETDTDGDGLPDPEEVGTYSPAARNVINVATNAPRDVDIADLDGDEDDDVAEGSDVPVWHENQDGAGLLLENPVAQGTIAAQSLVSADLDGDGDRDIVVGYDAGFQSAQGVGWYENLDGDGSFSEIDVIAGNAGVRAVFPADLDGDGDLEILWTSASLDALVWNESLGPGNGYGPAQIVTLSANGAWGVTAADLDGDDDLDVVIAAEVDDDVAWYENTDGAGSFGPKRLVASFLDGARYVAAGDVDGDGDADLVATARLDDVVSWFENEDGGGSFGPGRLIGRLDDPRFPLLVDVDGDGDLDAVASGHNDDLVVWWENDGSGGFGPALPIAGGLFGPNGLAAGDIDSDGRLDVAVAWTSSDTLAWYEPQAFTDPANPDTDGDGLEDGFEADRGFDPTDPDMDGDGLSDGEEVAQGSDPQDASSTEGPPPQLPALSPLARGLVLLLVAAAGLRRLVRPRSS